MLIVLDITLLYARLEGVSDPEVEVFIASRWLWIVFILNATISIILLLIAQIQHFAKQVAWANESKRKADWATRSRQAESWSGEPEKRVKGFMKLHTLMAIWSCAWR